MPNTSYDSNPNIRVHHPSPTPQPSSEQSMLVQRPFVGGVSGWPTTTDGYQYLNTVHRSLKDSRFHKRASSGSSITSVGPPSPLSQTTSFPHIATSDFAPYDSNFEYIPMPQSAQTSKSLPTPTTDHFMYQPTNNYNGVDMRRIHSTGADDNASYVSSMSHNSPATPHTNYEENYDDSKMYNGENNKTDEQWMDSYLPIRTGYQPTQAFQQSLQDVFPDQPSYQNPMTYQTQITPRMSNQMPQNLMLDRLQAAQQSHLRTSSPVTSNPREKSPYRQVSPMYHEQMRLPGQRQQQRPVPQLQKRLTSVSPKELMLEENDMDESSAPLFSENSQNIYNGSQTSNMSFYSPSFNRSQNAQIPQQYPFIPQPRQDSSHSQEEPPFPAHIASMESTMDEIPSEPSSQQSVSKQALQSKPQPTSRPVDTTSDAGTYSCTYHGCHERFETPAKLQKHKREGHRQASPLSHTQNIALRNSQAGPHKCERLNPSTGKPCNSIFSRPYDLTRHEDTIHNNRKMKVRCHLCTEEKTFSRNDALTRHMRVVHPDVEFSGRTKKHSSRV